MISMTLLNSLLLNICLIFVTKILRIKGNIWRSYLNLLILSFRVYYLKLVIILIVTLTTGMP